VREETLVTQLIRHKRVFEAMLTAMVGDADAAADLFQEMAVVMTRKREEVAEDCAFVAWGRAIALNVVRDYRKRRARRPMQFLDDDALGEVAAAFDREDSAWEDRRQALKACTDGLAERERQLLERRYSGEVSAEDLARELSMTRGALDTMLYRIRKGLLACVEQRLQRSGDP
jgi:RNA polymerase sigma-70 factor (ECF subfamily)